MKIKELVDKATHLLEQDDAANTRGASCVAVGRVWRMLVGPADRCGVAAVWDVWDVWADAAARINGGELPDWWGDFSEDQVDIELRVAHLRLWAELEGEQEFIV